MIPFFVLTWWSWCVVRDGRIIAGPDYAPNGPWLDKRLGPRWSKRKALDWIEAHKETL